MLGSRYPGGRVGHFCMNLNKIEDILPNKDQSNTCILFWLSPEKKDFQVTINIYFEQNLIEQNVSHVENL